MFLGRFGFLTAIVFLLAAGFAAAVVIVLLAVLGAASIDACGGGEAARPVVNSPTESDSFQSKWDSFNATLDAGQPASVTFTESEVTSRANVYMEEHGDDVQDIVICFHDGFGEASGKVNVPFLPFLPSVDVKVTGTVDLSGAEPQVEIDDIEVGSVPGPLADRVKGFVQGLIDGELDELEIEHTYDVSIQPVDTTVNGTP